jgi:glycosyltransferase involved in cell wall biosynthesis
MTTEGMKVFSGRLGVQQRVLPAYRAPFFETLASACVGGLSVFAGLSLPDESIAPVGELRVAHMAQARNWYLGNVSSPYYLCWQWGLLRWLERWQPQALIVEANPRYLSTRLAVRWMQARHRQVVGWGLGAPTLSGNLVSIQAWERRAFLKSLDAIISYSQRGAQEYQVLGFPADRIFVAPNAATSRPARVPPLRLAEFGDKPVVLFVGRLQTRKRIDTLLYACAALPESLQPRLIIVGDGPARGEFEALAHQVYLRAEFPGSCHGVELQPYFEMADVFVLPGTGGLAVQEAMAHGLPVVVAEGDGTQDDLVRPGNGWRVPPGDITTLSKTLQSALSDVYRLRRMGAESFRIVEQEINIEQMVGVFIDTLNHLASREDHSRVTPG